MSLQLRVVRAGQKRQRGEGVRIGTVRYLPRGVKKSDLARLDYFDVWLPILAPSRDLLSQYKNSGMTDQTFFRRYRSEMKATDPRQVIRLLAELARNTPISICCYCEDESRCHRTVLAELILQEGEPP